MLSPGTSSRISTPITGVKTIEAEHGELAGEVDHGCITR